MADETNVKKDGQTAEQAPAKVELDQAEYLALTVQVAEAKEAKEKLLRTAADLENSKKRLAKEKEDFVQYANRKIILEVLPILDNLKRAIQSAEQNHSLESLLKGVQLTDKQLNDVLKDHGLVKITAVGEKFDPHKHEAVGAIESDDYDDEVVVEEIAMGYMYKDTLLRPSMVRINHKPSAKHAETENK